MNAVAYIRVSTREQADEGVSLAAQRLKVEAYATFKGLNLVDVVVDAAVSAGKPLATRPGGARLLAAVATGEAEAVIACKLDRLFRDAADCLTVTRTWDGAGVALHLLDMGIDTSTAMGRAFLTMAAAFAELERNVIGERTRDGLAQVQRAGGTLGAEALGWERGEEIDADGRRVCREVEGELAAVGRIVELRAAGATYQAIADDLTAAGIPTKRGGRWYPATVRNVAKRAAVAP